MFRAAGRVAVRSETSDASRLVVEINNTLARAGFVTADFAALGPNQLLVQATTLARLAAGTQRKLTLKAQTDGTVWYEDGGRRSDEDGPPPWTLNRLADGLKTSAFRFRAERMGIGSGVVAGGAQLAMDGSNLPTVVADLLLSNQAAFVRYVEDVRRVLPHIRTITAPPDQKQGSGHVVLRIWKHPAEQERPDLAFDIKTSGTGVAQVLALVFVITTSRHQPRTIFIDEPQAFLHPRALRALMELIQDNGQHQYVIATHAPSVISMLRPQQIVEIRPATNHSHSTCVSFGGDDLEALHGLVQNLDVRWSELFGWDKVLWVEGPTEEACFRLVLEHACQGNRERERRLSHVGIKGIVDTGGFDQKRTSDIERVLRVYEVASRPQLVLPAQVAIVLDPEARASSDREALAARATRANLSLQWLPRTMYESYLLVPEAIAAVLSELCSKTLGITAVDEAVVAERAKPKATDAKIIAGVFAALSDQTVSYDKVRHGAALTRWLLANKPDHLSELSAFLVALVFPK